MVAVSAGRALMDHWNMSEALFLRIERDRAEKTGREENGIGLHFRVVDPLVPSSRNTL